jgi:non-canonical (house-cleaning) NTP pyrophosphatase
MSIELKAFWDRFQTGIEIAVGSSASHKLLGVRDGFLRYFHEGLHRPIPVVIVPHAEVEVRDCLPLSDEEAISAARREAGDLERQLGSAYHFYVASEGGLHSVELDGKMHYFTRSWSVIRAPVGEAWGGSGSIQLPDKLMDGLSGDGVVSMAIPGRRREGGMIASLTGGMETRRSAVATATMHALSTLFYGMLESHPSSRRYHTTL